MLTAAPNTDAVFTGWSGDAAPCELTPMCSFSMTSNRAVGARFNNLGTSIWAKAIQGVTGKTERVTKVVVDANGDLVILGHFGDDTLTIDDHQLQNHGPGFDDIFLVKLSRDAGAVLWAKAFGGSSQDYPGSVSVDPSSGDIILTALFIGDADFGGPMPLPGGQDHFNEVIARYSGDDGSLVWSNLITLSGFSATPIQSSVGSDGFLYVAVSFVDALTIGADTWTAPNDLDLLIAKYELNGQPAWIRQYGNPNSAIAATGIAVGSTGSIVVVGSFTGTWYVPFGTQLIPFASHGSTDGFVIQFEPTKGDWFAPFMGVLGGILYDSCYAVALSPQDDWVVACVSDIGIDPSTPVVLDYGSPTPPSGPAAATGQEVVVAAYSASTFPGPIVARRFGGVGEQNISWIDIDPILPEPRVLVGGGFSDSISFDSGHQLDHPGFKNVWIASLRLGDLSFVWADKFIGVNGNGFSAAVDRSHHRLLGVGDFGTTLQAGGKTLTANDGSDGYVISFLPRL